MPRIDPLSLLRCLSVLLGPNGGIKSSDQVVRVANLMSKFSKKLVSKCIYIQILKCTDPDLLNQFMSESGWNLIHTWLNDGIKAKNWALIQELLELILLCPVNIERLKSNDCPKLIKGLSKQEVHQNVRILASRIVEQWLKMVKGEANSSIVAQLPANPTSPLPPTSSTSQINQPLQFNSSLLSIASHVADSESAVTVQSSDSLDLASSMNNTLIVQQTIKASPQKSQPPTYISVHDKQQTVSASNSTSSVYRIIIRDGKQVLSQVHTDASNINTISANKINEINGDVNNVLPTEGSEHKRGNSQRSFVESESSTDGLIGSSSQASVIDQILKNDDNVTAEAVFGSGQDTSIDDSNRTDSVKNKDNDKDKSINDKENRNKKDDKKRLDKKDGSTSSKSSSKHSSSSSNKHGSSSHRSASHGSSRSSSSSSSKDKSSRDKDKHRSSSSKGSSSSGSSSSSSKSKTERDKEKEKLKKDQAEKDKATLEKLQSQTLSTKMGKIPKKKADEEKPGESPSRKSSTDSKDSFKENKESKKITIIPEKKSISMSIENRKSSQDQTASRPKTVKTFNSKFRSTGLEEEVQQKPPPPRGASNKKPSVVPDKKVLPPKLPLKRPSPLKETTAGPMDKKAKLSLDSPTTPPPPPPPNEAEKKGGIKLIPAKPKLMFLQESDMFMDALTASTKSKEPRKRKRRTSISKDDKLLLLPDAAKKSESNENNRDASSPPASPMSPAASTTAAQSTAAIKEADDKSLLAMKPTFKFYQETLETAADEAEKSCETRKENSEDDVAIKMDIDHEEIKMDKTDDEDKDRSRTPTPENDFDDDRGSSDSAEDPAAAVSEALKKEEHATVENLKPFGVLKSVLLLQKRKGPKKSLKWKTDLESIRYFELDETERVNVTKTFTDMKAMEKMNEREAFQMARKLNSEDVMEEKTVWKPLIPIDMPIPQLVEPGKDSREKDIQYAREKGILQALYFHRNMIPDSAAEPDEERHQIVIEPKVIPLDDLTGNKESEKDFSNVPWPEPKPQLPAACPAAAAASTIMQNSFFPPFRANQQQQHQPGLPPPQQQQMMPSGMGVQAPLGSMAHQPMMNSMNQAPEMVARDMQPTTGGGGGGGWRTGDGKIVSVPDPAMTPMANYQGIDGSSPMGPPPNMMGAPPHMYNQEGYMMGSDEMGFNNFQGPPGPGMFGPPGGPPGGPVGPPPGPHFQGGPRGPPPLPPPMHGNRGRGGPGWYNRGPGPRGMPWRGGGGWRGSGKQPPICRQFSKNGFCRVGDKCQFLHPGVNCPPYH